MKCTDKIQLICDLLIGKRRTPIIAAMRACGLSDGLAQLCEVPHLAGLQTTHSAGE